MPRCVFACAVMIALSGCAHQCNPRTVAHAPEPPAEPGPPEQSVEPAPPTRPGGDDWSELFPGVRYHADRRAIEVEAYVSPLIHSGLDGKNYYLEQFLCIPDTKEHESLLVTTAKPSHLHAALLLTGLQPGAPGAWDGTGEPTDASGPGVRVRFRYELGGQTFTVHPAAWTKHIDSREPMPERDWVFSGSTIMTNAGQPFYEADSAGTVIGLASFGGETLSWPEYISDDEATGDLVWLARTDAMPPAETRVTIVITPAD